LGKKLFARYYPNRAKGRRLARHIMDTRKNMRASSNPPSVLGGIPLSSQPEQLQGLELCLALLHPGRQFHSSIKNLRLFAITVYPDWISCLFRRQLSPTNHR